MGRKNLDALAALRVSTRVSRPRLASGLRSHRAAVGLVALVAAIGVLGIGVLVNSARGTSPLLWLMAGPALAAVVFIVTRGPLWCLAGLIIIDVLGLYENSLVAVGSLQLRSIDVFWVGLVGWMVVVRAREGIQPGRNVGQQALAFLILALAISLFPVAVRTPGLVSDAAVGWIRLVQTFSLVWLLPYGVRRLKDAEFALGVVIFASAAEIVRAVINAFATGVVGARLEAGNSANTEGLLAALLVVAALHAPIPRKPGTRAALLIIGLVGLLMARSLGATAAVVATLGIFGLRRPTEGGERSRASLLMPVRVILLVVAGVILASTFRAENLPSSNQFARSTTAHRAVLASAGLDLFVNHPIIGVGWQQSPLLITSPAVISQVTRTFGDQINPEFIPKQGSPLSVHNLYVQVLAEGGLLAFVSLLAFMFACVGGIRAALRAFRATPGYQTVRACAVLLFVIVVWWNDNALYGAQPETVIAATLIGVIASMTFAARSSMSES